MGALAAAQRFDDDDVRLDFAFTPRDTPRARARIERDLRLIARAVAREDPHVRALVLTGGFSRGEGTVRDDAPVNDYDLVAIRDRPGGGERLRAVAHELTARVGIEVDLLPVWRRRLPRLSPKLFWLDLKQGGRVIWGDARVLSEVPSFAPERLPKREGARLLGNRAAGLLLALPDEGAPADAHARDLQATKAALAAMDALLIARGAYAPTMRERLERARFHGSFETFAEAVEWKLGGSHAPRGDAWWDACARVLLQAVEETGARRSRDGLVEIAYHAARAKRVAATPSQDVRRAAWDLLAVSRFPEGPLSREAAARALSRIEPVEAAPWGELKSWFFARRALTLQ